MTTTSRKHRLSEWFKREKARHRAAQVADAFLKDPEPDPRGLRAAPWSGPAVLDDLIASSAISTVKK